MVFAQQPPLGLEIENVSIDSVSVKKEHLIGVKYGFAISGVSFTPDYKPKNIKSPLNLSLLYTFYHPLWHLNYFGLQTGVKYGTQGLTTEYAPEYLNQTITTIEIPFVSAFKVDVGDYFRILLNVGCFGGYRLLTDKEDGFDEYDRRWDYGLVGGGGIALKLHPVEIHIDCSYQYSFSWLYAPQKMSQDYWIYTYPHQLSFNIGLHFNL